FVRATPATTLVVKGKAIARRVTRQKTPFSLERWIGYYIFSRHRSRTERGEGITGINDLPPAAGKLVSTLGLFAVF
ncbi:MAG: hypothetical protein WBW60_03790, partial [Candidatus Sulfotelmatobacter sp.]